MTDYQLGYIRDEMQTMNRNMERLTLGLKMVNDAIKEEGRLNRLVTLIAAGVDPSQIDLTNIEG